MIEIIRVTFDGTVSYIENGRENKMTKEMARRLAYNSKASDYARYEDYRADMEKFGLIANAKETKR